MAVLTILNEWLKEQYEQPGRIQAMTDRKAVFSSKLSKRQDSGESFEQPALLHGGRAWAGSRAAAQSISNENEANLAPLAFKSFVGKQKGIVLNKTNAKKIIEISGSAITEEWPGTAIKIYPTETEFGGETVDCIRIKPVGKQAITMTAPPPPPKPLPSVDLHTREVIVDDIPF